MEVSFICGVPASHWQLYHIILYRVHIDWTRFELYGDTLITQWAKSGDQFVIQSVKTGHLLKTQ